MLLGRGSTTLGLPPFTGEMSARTKGGLKRNYAFPNASRLWLQPE